MTLEQLILIKSQSEQLRDIAERYGYFELMNTYIKDIEECDKKIEKLLKNKENLNEN